jgi:hypothetical protein
MDFRHPRSLGPGALLLVICGLLAAPARADDDLKVVKLTIKDHKLVPDRIELPSGSKAELTVTNEGPGTEEFESAALRIEKLIPMGKSITVKIGPLRSGTYDLTGDFHADSCKGTLVVL